VHLGNTQVLVEVKEIVPGDHEAALEATADDPDEPTIASNVARRIRNMIDEAKHQLRGLAKDRHSAILVIFDATQGLSGLDPEDFLNAMYGDEAVKLTSSGWRHVFAGKRKVGPSHNTSISALGHLIASSSSQTRLILYHSDYAKIPLDPSIAALLADSQFIRQGAASDSYRGWSRIHPPVHSE
jgi:hypothetical protein